jgi:hypothetical protein
MLGRQTRAADGDLPISSWQARIDQLTQSILDEERYFKYQTFAVAAQAPCSIAPASTPRLLKWREFSRKLKISRHYAAWTIQSFWRASQDKIPAEFPDLHPLFALTLADLQKAELKALHTISDDLLSGLLAQAIDAAPG